MAKFKRIAYVCACAGMFIGVPVITSWGVFYIMDKWTDHIEFVNCQQFARLDQVVRDCK